MLIKYNFTINNFKPKKRELTEKFSTIFNHCKQIFNI